MVTTIQIKEIVKEDLRKMKRSNSETYETVIIRLMKSTEKSKMKQLLEEGYKEMADDSVKINKEWEVVNDHWD